MHAHVCIYVFYVLIVVFVLYLPAGASFSCRMSQSTDPTLYIKKSSTSWHKSASTSCGKLDKMFAAAANPFDEREKGGNVCERDRRGGRCDDVVVVINVQQAKYTIPF